MVWPDGVPRQPSVPRDVRTPFTIAAIAMMTAYTHGVLVLSLGGQVAHDLVGSRNGFVNGAVLAVFPIVLGMVGILGRRLSVRLSMMLGAVASASGMGLLTVSVAHHQLTIFLLATAVAGAGYSLLFVSAIEVINAAAPPTHRGAVLSALYLLAYLSMGAVALILGVVATAAGLGIAIDLGAATIAILSFASFIAAVSMRPATSRNR